MKSMFFFYPKGVGDMPAPGAHRLIFAYAIHTEVGQCVGAQSQ